MSAPLPREPRPGERLDADWGRAVARALRSQRVSAGPGLRASQGPDGTTLSLAPGRGAGASRAAAPCPQWRITATPPAEEGGDWTVSVEGGSVVVADISLSDSGGSSGGSGGDGDHHFGGGGTPAAAIHVPTLSYGG